MPSTKKAATVAAVVDVGEPAPVKKVRATKKAAAVVDVSEVVAPVKKVRATKKAIVEDVVDVPEVVAPVKKVRATKKTVVADADVAEVEVEGDAEVVVPDSRTAEEVLTDLQTTLKLLGRDLVSRIRDSVKEALLATKVLKREARDVKKRKHKDPATMTPEERDVYEKRRANNAFLKPRPLTDELCVFMGLPSGSHKSQTDVTKFISAYVKEHACFDPDFKRTILPDAKLGKLLRAKDSDKVSYLNLQQFLKVHFIKTTPTVVASA